jgi:hypothetical protein
MPFFRNYIPTNISSYRSSGGGARLRRERAARDAAHALVTQPVPPEVIVEKWNNERSSVMLVTEEVTFFSCCVDRYSLAVDDLCKPNF